MAFKLSDAWERFRLRALPLVLLAGIGIFIAVVHRHYPVQKWLFWRYAAYWALSGIWSLSCLAAGHAVVRRVLAVPLPFLEHLTTSFPIGVYLFFLGMFAVGMLRGYGTACFIGLPLVMLLAGGPSLLRTLRRYARHVRYFRRAGPRSPLWTYGVLALGLVGALMVYFLILTPENVEYDSRWKHLALAEDYAVYGGIRRFPEGWTVATYPHLASNLYTWAFLLPRGALFDHVELAAHMEYVSFLWTLLAISALVRRMVPRAPAELVWVVRFLFPGIFLYDSSLALGADHIAAIFVIPLYTLLLRAWRDLDPRPCALLAAVGVGGCLVKYTSAFMLAPIPALALLTRAGALGVARLRGRAPVPAHRLWAGPLAALVTGLALSAPHWLKNWIWYKDPVYPSSHTRLTPEPWTVDAATLFEWGYKDFQFWRPSRDLEGVLKTIGALFTFSFKPNDWTAFHGHVPVFGSLFTLLLVCLPFLRGTRRIVGLAVATHAALAVWYWIHHQDRYIQTLVPWMAVVTASIIVLLLRSGRVTQVMLGALVAVQVIWGGDVYFIPTHAMIGSPLKAVIDLLSSGYRREYDKRLRAFAPWSEIGEALPKGAHVLVHDSHVHLGIHATTVSDWGGWQFGLSYGRLPNPRMVHEALTRLGVTHLVWEENVSRGWDSLAGDIVFFDFALKYAEVEKHVGRMILAKMPHVPPPDQPGLAGPVSVFACKDSYPSGLYRRIEDLTVPVFGPQRAAYPKPEQPAPPPGEPADLLLKSSAYVVVDTSCYPKLPSLSDAGFVLAARRPLLRAGRGGARQEIWIRHSNKHAAAEAPRAPQVDGKTDG